MQYDTHVTELLPGYALDCLETEEAVKVAHHLSECAQCREELEAFRVVAAHLAMAVPEVSPPAELKARIMQATRPASRPKPERSPLYTWWQSVMEIFRPMAPAWNLAGIALILLLGISTGILWQRLNTLEEFYQTRDFQLVKLECTHIVPEATGQIVISNDGEIGSLAVAHLPVLEPGYVYQVWLTQDEQQMNGGTFTVNAQGYGMLKITSPQSLLECEIHITIEPEQGNGQPTGKTVLQMMI